MGRRRVIALLLLSSVLLITLDIRGNAAIGRLRGVFSVVIGPFDAASRAVSRPIVNAWNGISDYERLQRENEALQEQVDRQRGAEIEAAASILDYQELQGLSRLESVSSYPHVIGEVLGESPNNFRYTVEINRGSLDGVGVGMPVLNQAGLVGKITSVSPSSSIVLLITDPDFSIGAKVLTAVSPSNPLTTVAIDPGGDVFGGSTVTSSSTSTTMSSTLPTETTTTIPSLDPPATDPAGVGTTSSTSSTSSTSTSTTVPFEVVRETGTLSGQGKDRPLILRFVDASSTTGKLQVGSRVQTSGGNDSIAPANLPIGTVRSVSSQSGSSVPVVEVELSADLTKLNYLTVLLYNPSGSAG